ncbi:zinc knuckle CX2CX4HX4C containing protein [Tanacetum coccineum]
MEGTELTKQECESKLYDDFDRFTSEKGESIHSYYLRFAKWCAASPLSSIISSRDIFRAGWNLSTKVRDLIHEGNWHWTNDWTTKYPLLCDIPVPMISNEKCDYLEWRDNGGVGKPFSVYHICMHLKKFAGLSNSGYTFDSIMTLLLPVAKRKASKSTIGKLVIAAAAYFIWQERNRRLFKNTKRSAKDVIECVMSSVRMKLLSCHFKKSKDGLAFAHLWELPSTCFNGTYVESLDGVVREKTAVNEHVNLNGKSSESLQSGPGEGSNTFASLLKNPNVPATTKVVRLQATKNSETVQGANVVIPMAVVEKMSNRFENTLYGYFIGHRLAFPLVENYVKNAWAKYGLERTMLKKGFFFFQFLSSEGMEKVLENGPWMIRLVPIFLNIWTPNTKLTKDTITAAPIWVKMHNVPIVAYCEEGLSLITSQIGSPIMLDAYTSTVCKKSWGKNDYTRALIEVSSNTPMKDNVVVAISFLNRTGHSLETVDIEYEWVPPRCDVCKVFDHDDVDCPKRVKETVDTHEEDDGYTR